MNNATVYIAGPGIADASAKVAGEDCPLPPEDYIIVTCTEEDGSFQLSGLEAGVYQITLVRGAFKTSYTADASSASGAVTTEPVSLTGSNVRMALVTGFYDHMENVLAKTGFGNLDEDGQLDFGSEQFDIYDGTGDQPEDYPPFSQLLETNPATGTAYIFDYDIVFINCGAEETNAFEFALDPEDETTITTLQAYVSGGGRLYATDWAYDYVEQAFPGYLDFYPEVDDGSEAEALDDAQQGLSGIVVEDAAILDTGLTDFLANSVCDAMDDGNCLNADGSLYIEGFLSGWAILNGAHETATGVTLYVQGSVTSDGDNWFTKPLTAAFTFGSGQVFYSSYHSEETGLTGFLPQERVMQYLIFE